MAGESTLNKYMLMFGAQIDQASFDKTKVGIEQKTDEILAAKDKITSEPAGKVPEWAKGTFQALEGGDKALQDFSKELEGFALVNAKVNQVWKEGEVVGSQLTQTYKNFSGEIKSVTSSINAEGEIVSQSLKTMGEGAAIGKTAIKDFSKELEGFGKVSTKLNTIYEDGQEIGLKTTETYKNQSGAIKELSQSFDKSGNIIGQSLRDTIKEVESGGMAVRDFSKELEGFNKTGSKISTTFGSNNEQLSKTTDIYKNQAGAIKEITTVTDKQGKVTGQTLNEISKGATQTAGYMEQMGAAMKRALIVAPVWMAVRAGMQLIIQSVKEGIDYWLAFEKAIIKVNAVVHTSTARMSIAVGKLREDIRKLSMETGASMENIAKVFYRFGTLGIKVEESWAGTVASIKLAMATQGEADIVAKSFAMAQRLLTSEVDKSLTPLQQQEAIAGKIYYLWKSNAFESNEFAQSLANFLPTAKIANFTMEQTSVLLASLGTAGVIGARGGTLLRQSIFKLVENLDNLAPSLGLSVNPELEDMFDVLMRVLGAVNELSKTEKGIPVEAISAMVNIFGGTRGTQPIAALNALLPELRKNLIDAAKDPQFFWKILNDRINEIKESIPGQLDIFSNYKKMLGEAFVVGIVNAKGFNSALLDINKTMPGVIEYVREYAKIVGLLVRYPLLGFAPVGAYYEEASEKAQKLIDLHNKLLPVIQNEATSSEIINLYNEINKNYTEKELDGKTRILELLKSKYGLLKQEEVAQIKLGKQQVDEEKTKQAIEKRKEELSLTKKISDEIQKFQTQELQYSKMRASGIKDSEIAEIKVLKTIETLVDAHNKLKDASGELVKPINTHYILSLALEGNYKKILEIMPELKSKEEELKNISKGIIDIEKEKYSLMEDYLAKFSEVARFAGASESAILRQTMGVKALALGEDYIRNSMGDRLKLAQAMTKEMDEQNKKSSYLVELFKIAKKYGIETAQEFSKFLAGATKFEDLSEKTKGIVKRVEPTMFEEAKAEEFFKEREPSFLFPEKIEKEREIQRNIEILNRINIEPISINVDIDSQRILEQVTTTLVNELNKKESEFSKAINKKIENF